MGEIINFPIPLDGELGRNFVTDCARHCEGLLSEAAIKSKYHFDDSAWTKLADDDALVRAVEAEKSQRIKDGSSARERAQILFAQTPAVLGDILHGEGVSPRHKIESARELRAIAANGPEAAPAATLFSLRINLGDESLVFSKSLETKPNDGVDPLNDTDTTSQGLLETITTRDGDDGQPI